MEKNNRKYLKIVISIISLIIVITVIILSFVYRNTIEEYAAVSYFGVLVACIASTATILLPAPGILVVLRYAQIFNPFAVIVIGGAGTAIGEMVGYVFGRSGNELLQIDKNRKLFSWFSNHPNIMVLTFSLIPLPIFDFIGISAGATKMNPIKFLGLCALGKTIKMALFVLLFNILIPRIPFLQDQISRFGK